MSAKDQTAWTCDRCGRTATSPVGSTPTVWGGHVIATLPGMVNKRIDLCNPCEVRLRHHLKMDAAWRIFDVFTDAAMDYFDHPAGTHGNRERADKARALLALLNDYETDSTEFYESGDLVGPPHDWTIEHLLEIAARLAVTR